MTPKTSYLLVLPNKITSFFDIKSSYILFLQSLTKFVFLKSKCSVKPHVFNV